MDAGQAFAKLNLRNEGEKKKKIIRGKRRGRQAARIYENTQWGDVRFARGEKKNESGEELL